MDKTDAKTCQVRGELLVFAGIILVAVAADITPKAVDGALTLDQPCFVLLDVVRTKVGGVDRFT